MNRINCVTILLITLFVSTSSCHYPKNFTQNFYAHNEPVLKEVLQQYKDLYAARPFNLLFEDKAFTEISIEINNPEIKYVYGFNTQTPTFNDTAYKYGYDTVKMNAFISSLKKIGCTWITTVDYYEDFQKKYLVQMAIRNNALNAAFKGESYCLLAFFNSKQLFDEKGRVLDKSERNLARQVNGYKLKRISDSVGYCIAKHYR